MPLELEIISKHRDLVGDDAVREFHESGGTIGRSLHNDWILPDPDRYISGKHAAVDCRGGIYYLTDLSRSAGETRDACSMATRCISVTSRSRSSSTATTASTSPTSPDARCTTTTWSG